MANIKPLFPKPQRTDEPRSLFRSPSSYPTPSNAATRAPLSPDDCAPTPSPTPSPVLAGRLVPETQEAEPQGSLFSDDGAYAHRRLNLLARSAAAAPVDSTGHLTQYRPLQTRSILSKTNSQRGMPFTHAINPYRGCEFACRYCYARYAHEFIELTPEDFERNIFYKQNAGWLLQQELARLKPGTQIALGTATDPWQPLERRQKVTRSILEAFAKTTGFSVGIVTKSTLITRDLDLLKEIAGRHSLTVHLTVTTMNTRLARVLEPRAPRPDLRIRTLARVREAGIRAGVLCSPLMPGITDSRRSIGLVARAAAGAGANFFAAGALFLKSCSLPTFLKFVEEHFPEQLAAYRSRYGSSAFVSAEYRKRVGDIVDSVCREYKLGRRYEEMTSADDLDAPNLVQIQPWLPFNAGGDRDVPANQTREWSLAGAGSRQSAGRPWGRRKAI